MGVPYATTTQGGTETICHHSYQFPLLSAQNNVDQAVKSRKSGKN